MTKIQLKNILDRISKEYEITDMGEKYLSDTGYSIESYTDALHNDDLVNYLLDNDICPCESDIKEFLIKYANAPAIITTFIDDLNCLAYEFTFYQKPA